MTPVHVIVEKNIRDVMGNKIKIKESVIDGKGIFAVKPIRKGELICYMNGEEISISELKKRYEKGEERLSDPLQVGEKTYIDLYEPYVYINHSCSPNSAVMKFNELVAIEDIKAEQEIMYDYSLTEWSDEESWQDYDDWFIKCKCRSSLCRNKIEEFYLLPKDIQEKCIKQGNVRNFIVKRYKECHGK